MAKSKEQNYLHGAAILTAGVIIMKILGAIYKIPIKNMIGDDGYALFLSAYNVYSLFLTLATAGLPVALSRMISEARTNGRTLQARRTFSVAWTTFFTLGLICSLIMFIFPEQLANGLNNPDTALSIRVLAPSVLLVCLISAYRGYCQGHENMIPTTVGQVIEVLVKVIVGLALAWYIMRQGADKSSASAGAIFGVTVGSAACLAYMVIYKKRNYSDDAVASPDIPDDSAKILKDLVRIGIPIALGSIVLSLINLLDSSLCMGRLQDAAGFTYSEAKVLYGVYGAAQTLFNVPAAFITPLTISVVPAIAGFIVNRNYEEASKVAEDSLRISTAIALPMAIGLSVMAYPIMNVVYPDSHESGSMLLCLLGIASFFVCFSLMTTAILQAQGKEKLTMFSIIAGGVVKIVINWFLVAIPDVNIMGAPIGTIGCYVTMCVMNLIFMCTGNALKPNIGRIFARPVLAGAIMGVLTYAVYFVATKFIPGGRLAMALCLCIAVMAAVLVYLVAIIRLRAITADDMKLIPKGEKIAKLLKMK